jgi:hypothetical protein
VSFEVSFSVSVATPVGAGVVGDVAISGIVFSVCRFCWRFRRRMNSQRKKRISRTTITAATAIPAFAPVLSPSLLDDLLLWPVVHEYEFWNTLSSPVC